MSCLICCKRRASNARHENGHGHRGEEPGAVKDPFPGRPGASPGAKGCKVSHEGADVTYITVPGIIPTNDAKKKSRRDTFVSP